MGSMGKRLFPDRQRALEKRPRRAEIALLLKHAGEVVEARGRIRMRGAERLITQRERRAK